MKSIILVTVVLFSTVLSQAQINNPKTETVKVYGNCEKCEATIEKSANIKGISKADWNEDTKLATIIYDSKKTNLDAVLKNIALAGYDSDKFLAPDETYNKLPDCCKYERENKITAKMEMKPGDHEAAEHSHNTAGNNTKPPDQEKQEANQLQLVFDNYFLLKDALVKTNGVEAAAKVTSLLSLINAVKMEKLTEEEHTVWMEKEKNLKLYTRQISETKNTTVQREYFSHLSNDVYALLKVSKTPGTVYWQNCPMYNEGKGANWLSKENAIKNPYYGATMLTCGKTVETIK